MQVSVCVVVVVGVLVLISNEIWRFSMQTFTGTLQAMTC